MGNTLAPALPWLHLACYTVFSPFDLEQKGLSQVSLLFQTIFLRQHFNTRQFQLSVILEHNLAIAENKIMTVSVSAAWCRTETEDIYQSSELGPAWCRTESDRFYHSLLKWWQDARKYTEPGWYLKWTEPIITRTHDVKLCSYWGMQHDVRIIDGSGDVCGSWQ